MIIAVYYDLLNQLLKSKQTSFLEFFKKLIKFYPPSVRLPEWPPTHCAFSPKADPKNYHHFPLLECVTCTEIHMKFTVCLILKSCDANCIKQVSRSFERVRIGRNQIKLRIRRR